VVRRAGAAAGGRLGARPYKPLWGERLKAVKLFLHRLRGALHADELLPSAPRVKVVACIDTLLDALDELTSTTTHPEVLDSDTGMR